MDTIQPENGHKILKKEDIRIKEEKDLNFDMGDDIEIGEVSAFIFFVHQMFLYH